MFNLLFSNPLAFVIFLIVILASLSFHEFAHAWAGLWQGDETAKRMGRLTLDPRAHVDPVGLLALVLVGFGWGRPVPFNPYNLRDRRWGPVLVAAAGPLANVILLVLAGVALRLLFAFTAIPDDNALVVFLWLMVWINTALFVFNLIPVPPLDGSKFLLAALDHPQHARTRFILETKGPMILLLAIAADAFLLGGALFGTLLGLVSRFVTSVLGLGALQG